MNSNALADNHASQRLPWEASYNIRDLGGYPTLAGQRIRSHTLVRADNLGHLTANGQAALIAYGIRTIIDVRSTYEATTWPHAFTAQEHLGSVDTSVSLQGAAHFGSAPHLVYVNSPLGEVQDGAIQAQLKQAAASEWNCLVVDHAQQQIATIFRLIACAADGGIVIHCHAGKDRTGLIAALLLRLVGVDPALIAQDYAASDQYLQPLYAEWLNAVAYDPIRHAKLKQDLTSSPETMRTVLAYVDAQYGGIASYVQGCGIRAEEIVMLRQRLCTAI